MDRYYISNNRTNIVLALKKLVHIYVYAASISANQYKKYTATHLFITVMSHLKSLKIQLFVHQLVQASNKEKLEICTLPFVSRSHWLILLKKQQCGNCFHVPTSSWKLEVSIGDYYIISIACTDQFTWKINNIPWEIKPHELLFTLFSVTSIICVTAVSVMASSSWTSMLFSWCSVHFIEVIQFSLNNMTLNIMALKSQAISVLG